MRVSAVPFLTQSVDPKAESRHLLCYSDNAAVSHRHYALSTLCLSFILTSRVLGNLDLEYERAGIFKCPGQLVKSKKTPNTCASYVVNTQRLGTFPSSPSDVANTFSWVFSSWIAACIHLHRRKTVQDHFSQLTAALHTVF